MKEFRKIGVQAERSRAHGRTLLEGLAEFALARYDWRLDLMEPEQFADAAALSTYDGFIVRVMDDATARALRATGKPVIDTYGRIDTVGFTTLRLDDAAIAEMAAGFYAERHYRTVAYCGFPGLRFSDAREKAFAAAAAARDMDCLGYRPGGRSGISDTFFREEQTGRVADAAALRGWLRKLPKPIAIFCCNDIRAFQLMKACEALDVRVPDDAAVLGVDNDTLLCSFTASPISSIDTDPTALGRHAGELLAEAFDGRRTEPRIIRHPPRRIIERASTDAFLFSNPWLSDAMVFIRHNLPAGITAADVVRHLGCSHTTVNHAFHAELGTTVQREIIRQRVALACRKLRETSDPASKISLDVGFRSPQYFSKVFFEAYGKTPDAWRRELK